jgi:hypothetical protein
LQAFPILCVRTWIVRVTGAKSSAAGIRES